MAKTMGELYTVVSDESIAANDSWSQSSSFLNLSNQHMLGVEISVINDSVESIEDEEMSFTSPATTYDTGYTNLDNVVVTSADDLTTFTVDVDYSVDSATGVITYIDSGTSGWADDGTVYHLDYDYTPIVDGEIIVKVMKSLDNDVFEAAANATHISTMADIDYNGMIDVVTIPVFGCEKVKFKVENHDALHSVSVTIKCRNTIL
jgi:hypothetical protein